MSIQKKRRTGKAEMDTRKDMAESEVKSSWSPAGIRQFVLEVQAEFKKVVWPAKKTTIGLTGFVVLLVVVLAIYLGSIDLLLGKLVSLVLR